MTEDWFIERLGRSQQRVMSLTVENRALKMRLDRLEDREEQLEGALLETYLDLKEGQTAAKVLSAVRKRLDRLDERLKEARHAE